MNHCRICNKIIPDRFNWWQALRCSRCRARKDQELAELIEKNHWIDVENDSLIYAYTNMQNKEKNTEYKYKKLKIRYDLLRQRNSVVLNDNQRLETENQRLRKWIERLFARIHVLEWRNAEWLKDYKQLKSEILSDEQSNDEEERAKRL